MYKVQFSQRAKPLYCKDKATVDKAVKLYNILKGSYQEIETKKGKVKIYSFLTDVPPYFMHPKKEKGIEYVARSLRLCLTEAFSGFAFLDDVSPEEAAEYVALFGTEVDKQYSEDLAKIQREGYYTEDSEGFRKDIPLYWYTIRPDIYKQYYGDTIPEAIQAVGPEYFA